MKKSLYFLIFCLLSLNCSNSRSLTLGHVGETSGTDIYQPDVYEDSPDIVDSSSELKENNVDQDTNSLHDLKEVNKETAEKDSFIADLETEVEEHDSSNDSSKDFSIEVEDDSSEDFIEITPEVDPDTEPVCIPQGECDTGKPGICSAGIEECQENQLFCVQTNETTDELCDDLDNDCDSKTDEDWPELEQPCDSNDKDFCQNGIFICNDNKNCVSCDETVIDIEEACGESSGDDIDNDCNGYTDEGCACTEDQTNGPCGPDKGECKIGNMTCVNEIWACIGGKGEEEETCDGLDNDCDSITDELTAGDQCKTEFPGVCQDGITVCNNGELECEMLTNPSGEKCDDLDNNCNGAVDEGNPEGGNFCNTGNQGICANGVKTCLEGNIICVGNEPNNEFCDGYDNDCDSETDEDLALDQCDTGYLGECAEGEAFCSNGELFCMTTLEPDEKEEECGNDLDDDCDSKIDEGCLFSEDCLEGMVYIPESENLPAFCIDAYEASLDGNGAAQSKTGIIPKTQISWFEAKEACKKSAKQLCSEDQFNFVCKPLTSCNAACPGSSISPTGNSLTCQTSSGIFDILGNVMEWTTGLPINPDVCLNECYLVKAGTKENCKLMTCDSGMYKTATEQNKYLGFRCCKSKP